MISPSAPIPPNSASAFPANPQSAAPRRKTAQEYIYDCQGLVRSLAWKIRAKLPNTVDMEDLISYGQVGLAQAARDYNPSHGTQFTTYAYYRIRGAIFDGLAQMSWFSRADYHRNKYQRLSNDVLRLSSEEQPREDQTAEAQAGWLGNIAASLSIAYIANEAARAAELQDQQQTPPDRAEQSEIHQKLRQLIDELPAEAAQLIRGAYFEGATLQEIGRRLGISKGWASRLHAKTLEKLAQGLRRAQAAT